MENPTFTPPPGLTGQQRQQQSAITAQLQITATTLRNNLPECIEYEQAIAALRLVQMWSNQALAQPTFATPAVQQPQSHTAGS